MTATKDGGITGSCRGSCAGSTCVSSWARPWLGRAAPFLSGAPRRCCSSRPSRARSRSSSRQIRASCGRCSTLRSSTAMARQRRRRWRGERRTVGLFAPEKFIVDGRVVKGDVGPRREAKAQHLLRSGLVRGRRDLRLRPGGHRRMDLVRTRRAHAATCQSSFATIWRQPDSTLRIRWHLVARLNTRHRASRHYCLLGYLRALGY